MKINLTTLGCPKNLVDSEVLLGGLRGNGVEFVDDPAEADTIILNTCGFIQGAKEESIDSILEAVQLKSAGRCQRVFVTGCLSQRYREELERAIPEVDGFYGNRDLVAIVRDLAERLDLKRELLGERHLTTPRHFAYLKISEGCENPCTFCSIPAIRGPFQSRAVEELVREARHLAERGARELILIAQDTTLYGQDRYGRKMLVPLLEQLVKLNAFKWIRLLYTYPAHFGDDLIAFLAQHPPVNYVDMPIQHISDHLLRRMARKTTRRAIERIIERLRSSRPDLALRTSLVVGFPGETEDDHAELVRFVEDVRFERLGLFAFSREEGTPAYAFRHQVSPSTANRWLAELQDVQTQISGEKNAGLLGTRREVVVDGYDEASGQSFGRTAWDCPEIDNCIWVPGKLEQGGFYPVEITESGDYELSGVVVSKPEPTRGYHGGF